MTEHPSESLREEIVRTIKAVRVVNPEGTGVSYMPHGLADRVADAILALPALSDKASGWREIESAPRNVPLLVKTERGRVFRAIVFWLDEDAGWTWGVVEDDDPCPSCWTDGVCWNVNADQERSDWPGGWRPLPNPPAEGSSK